MAQERDVAHEGGGLLRERRDGESDAATLTRAGDGNPAGIDRAVAADRLDGADGVREHAAVEVVARIADPSRREPGLRRGGADRIRCVPYGPPAALAAGVRHEVRVAGERPQQMLVDEPAPAVVPLVLDDGREPTVHRAYRAGR